MEAHPRLSIAIRGDGKNQVPSFPRLAARMYDELAPRTSGDSFAAQIVAIAERGDRAAFGSLFAHFAPRVKAYLMRLGAPASVAEELSQEAMLVVWRKATYYDPRKSQASTWIFTIARNLRIDALRREARPELHPDEPALVPTQPQGAEESIAAHQYAVRLREALKTLPPSGRASTMNFATRRARGSSSASPFRSPIRPRSSIFPSFPTRLMATSVEISAFRLEPSSHACVLP